MGDCVGSGQIIGRHLDHLRDIFFEELLHAQVSPELQLSLNCVLKVNGLFVASPFRCLSWISLRTSKTDRSYDLVRIRLVF